MRSVAALTLALGLASCGGQWIDATLGPTAERQAAEERRQLREQAHEKCVEFGFEQGTENYANCRLRLEELYAPLDPSSIR